MHIRNPLLLLLFCFIMTVTAHGQYALGGGLDYNVDVKRTGLFLRGSYRLDDQWRMAGTFNLFLEGRSRQSQWEVAADAHYFFWTDGLKMSSYLLGGLNLHHRTRTRPESGVGESEPGTPLVTDRSNHFGVSLGAGFQTQITERLYPFAEAKVSVGDGSLFGLFVGVQYFFDRR